MALLFLDVINASLKRVRVVQGDAGELATSTVTSTATGLVATGAFTDSGRQTQIDLMIQVWQEAIHELYSLDILPKNTKDGTITLVAQQRNYDFPTDFERMAGKLQVLRGATTNLILTEYPGGYEQILADQPNATDFTGDPNSWVINPITKQLYLDREPTSQQAGHTYNFLYEKRIGYSSTMATELMPFSDTVADALVPVAAEGWNRIYKKEFDSTLFRNSVARAAKTVTNKQARIRYGVRRG
jgi:hypothetical protein